MKKAKEHEKRYEWLQAKDNYKKAQKIASKVNSFEKSAELHYRMGFCFFKAALQAKTKSQFKLRMNSAIEEYENSAMNIQKSEDKQRQIKTNNAFAMVAYVKSWLEIDPIKKKAFLDEWWSLKSAVLTAYENIDEKLSIAITINDMLEGSADGRYWIESNEGKLAKIRAELITLGERAIAILKENGPERELARAYCWTSNYYSLGNSSMMLGGRSKQILQKAVPYSQKAIELSSKIDDAYLLGWSYSGASDTADRNNDPKSAIDFVNRQIEQGEIAEDNYLIGYGTFMRVLLGFIYSLHEEDPEQNRAFHKRNLQGAQDVIRYYILCNFSVQNHYYAPCLASIRLASFELDLKTKYDLLKKAVEYGRKGVRQFEGWNHAPSIAMFNAFSWALYELSKIEPDSLKKRQLLNQVLKNTKRNTRTLKSYPSNYYMKGYTHNWITLVKSELSRLTSIKAKKIKLLQEAVSSIDACIKVIKENQRDSEQSWFFSRFGGLFYRFGTICYQLYLQTKENNLLSKALSIYEESIVLFKKADFVTGIAECYWQKAKIQDQFGEHLNASKDYESSAEAYLTATEKIPQLKDFYHDHSSYMQAWSQIEQARYFHAIEAYEKAQQCYEKAAKIHESTSLWSYLTPNYFAWSYVEEAEKLSRIENTQLAKQTFQKAMEQFDKAEQSIKQRLGEIESSVEKEMTQKLFEVSGLRKKYCQVRLLMEEAKLLDRDGNYLQSSKKYRKAAHSISAIVDKIDVEAERNELKYIAILCRAWEKMENAEETASFESYLEAAALFGKAKKYCSTKKANLWALGNSNFCRGLAAGLQYKTSLDMADHTKAKSYISNASTDYLQAGFKAASEYAKATQRLFDAYAYMNQAEGELNPEKKAKQYQMAENLLQLAAGSYIKAKQPEKSAQLEEILANVREEKALAVSLSQVMQAPTIVTSTLSFSAPSPTSESSVGLERFEHADVQANLIAGARKVRIRESFYLSLEFINAGKEPALLLRVEDFVPSGFVVVKKPEIYRLEESCLNMKGKQLAPLKLVEVKLTLQASKKGEYELNPKVHYLDERGQNKSLQLKNLEIKVEEVVLSGRVSTGTPELDSLLLGGVPEGYAVALTGPPSDDRDYLIKNFLEAGTKENETVFYVATEADALKNLLEKQGFHLFLCNPKPKTQVPDLPNVYKLRSKTDLTNLSISLAKAYRNIDQSKKKRICIETVSNVLLDYEAKATCKWVSELITNLGSKGFTMLAVMNPAMHPPDQVNAVLDLFDGEITITQTKDPLECKNSIRVTKLQNQDHLENPICLLNT